MSKDTKHMKIVKAKNNITPYEQPNSIELTDVQIELLEELFTKRPLHYSFNSMAYKYDEENSYPNGGSRAFWKFIPVGDKRIVGKGTRDTRTIIINSMGHMWFEGEGRKEFYLNTSWLKPLINILGSENVQNTSGKW